MNEAKKGLIAKLENHHSTEVQGGKPKQSKQSYITKLKFNSVWKVYTKQGLQKCKKEIDTTMLEIAILKERLEKTPVPKDMKGVA